MEEFVEGEFFAGELYVDEAKASFQQLGFKRFSLMRLLPKLCSSKWKNANEEAKAKGLGGNLKGDGGQTGGVLVVGQGGAPTMFTYKQMILLITLRMRPSLRLSEFRLSISTRNATILSKIFSLNILLNFVPKFLIEFVIELNRAEKLKIHCILNRYCDIIP